MAQITYSGNPFTSYSSFFSSGLLAQHTPHSHSRRRGTINSDVSEPWDDEVLSSPVPLPDDSVMDIDMSDFASASASTSMSGMRRSTTPTPHSPTQPREQTTPVQAKAQPTSTQSPAQAPRLRRRRSSLTQATSPITAIRSPTRSVGNALHLQMQLPGRARSGSVGEDALGAIGMGIGMATESTSMVGRMRRGSCSSVHSLPGTGTGMASAAGSVVPVAFRPRRAVRKLPMPALRAPPPTAPLPALPLPSPLPPLPSATSSYSFSTQQKLRPSNLNINLNLASSTTTTSSATHAHALNGNPSAGLKSPTTLTSARARGLSVSSSALDGDENRIDEEMKEN